MNSGNKVARYRKRKSVNIGVLVFLIIFVYVLISVSIYLTKDHLTIYEVKEGSTSDDSVFTGMIFREEEVITTNTAGYVNYYHGDGARVSKNSTIYSVDENKDSYDLIGNSDEAVALTPEDTITFKKEIINFQKTYQDSNYQSVYNFKYDMENSVLEVVNNHMLSKLQSVLNENGTNNTLKVMKSKASGIIIYSIDDLEDLSIDAVTAENFKTDNYKKTQLRTMDLIEKGSPVYKIIKSDDWSILLLLTKEQYTKLTDKETVKITFSDDGLSTSVPISVYQKGTDYFARLDFNKFMIRYINQRFVNVEIAVNSAQGLKIPISSIVKKDFYQVPLNYFTEGGDSGSTGLIKESYADNGDLKYVFVPTDIYYSDENFGYIDARLFEPGDKIHSEETDKEFNISQKQTLEGVFNVNKGYAAFRRIEVLYENEEYCIVKEGTQYGLSVYDHIALDCKTAVEQKIIY
ncbi:MAG: HlyD family efflux transporter periplasmic adaptor subunit [Anaerocolumna sp.]